MKPKWSAASFGRIVSNIFRHDAPFLAGYSAPPASPGNLRQLALQVKGAPPNEFRVEKHSSKWWIVPSNVYPMPQRACSSYKSWKRIGSRFAFLCRLACLDCTRPLHRMLYIPSRHLMVLALLRSRNAAKLGVVASCVAQTCLSI